MNYKFEPQFALSNIKIKSSWFDHNKDNYSNKYQKIGYEGLYLYLTMFKFKMYRPLDIYNHTFIFNISLLRKETGYDTKSIFDLLKLFHHQKILSYQLTRWDYLVDKSSGRIKDKELIICHTIDSPQIMQVEPKSGDSNKYGFKEVPLDESNAYINICTELIDYYINVLGLHERYIGLYCLLSKLENNVERKSWMSISKMANVLGYSKDSVNKMIHVMNQNYLLASVYKKRYAQTSHKQLLDHLSDDDNNNNGDYGSRFEHHILRRYSDRDEFIKTYKNVIDVNLSRWQE